MSGHPEYPPQRFRYFLSTAPRIAHSSAFKVIPTRRCGDGPSVRFVVVGVISDDTPNNRAARYTTSGHYGTASGYRDDESYFVGTILVPYLDRWLSRSSPRSTAIRNVWATDSPHVHAPFTTSSSTKDIH
jgi:hypothetical protein